MILRKRSKFDLQKIMILTLILALIISVGFNFILYKNNKDFLKFMDGFRSSDKVTRESIIENLNSSCNNFKNKNSTIMSLGSVLSLSRSYVDSQIKLVYLYCDILAKKNICELSSKEYSLGDNIFITTLLVMKKYVNNEISENEFNSIMCNLTTYFKNSDLASMQKLRENI